jgi:hypothetical protein
MRVLLKGELIKRSGTLGAAAESLEISEARLSEIVQGKRLPTIHEIAKLMKFFSPHQLSRLFKGQMGPRAPRVKKTMSDEIRPQ